MLARARAGGELWSTTDHLLAAVVDHTGLIAWMYAETHRDHDKHPQPFPVPAPVPRPGETADAPTDRGSAYDLGHVPAIDPAELGAWLST